MLSIGKRREAAKNWGKFREQQKSQTGPEHNMLLCTVPADSLTLLDKVLSADV